MYSNCPQPRFDACFWKSLLLQRLFNWPCRSPVSWSTGLLEVGPPCGCISCLSTILNPSGIEATMSNSGLLFHITPFLSNHSSAASRQANKELRFILVSRLADTVLNHDMKILLEISSVFFDFDFTSHYTLLANAHGAKPAQSRVCHQVSTVAPPTECLMAINIPSAMLSHKGGTTTWPKGLVRNIKVDLGSSNPPGP